MCVCGRVGRGKGRRWEGEKVGRAEEQKVRGAEGLPKKMNIEHPPATARHERAGRTSNIERRMGKDKEKTNSE